MMLCEIVFFVRFGIYVGIYSTIRCWWWWWRPCCCYYFRLLCSFANFSRLLLHCSFQLIPNRWKLTWGGECVAIMHVSLYYSFFEWKKKFSHFFFSFFVFPSPSFVVLVDFSVCFFFTLVCCASCIVYIYTRRSRRIESDRRNRWEHTHTHELATYILFWTHTCSARETYHTTAPITIISTSKQSIYLFHSTVHHSVECKFLFCSRYTHMHMHTHTSGTRYCARACVCVYYLVVFFSCFAWCAHFIFFSLFISCNNQIHSENDRHCD